MSKWIIAGGRNEKPLRKHWEALNLMALRDGLPTKLISNGEKGMDKWGRDWANEVNVEIEMYKMDFSGLKNNREKWEMRKRGNDILARRCDRLVAFFGGKGFNHLVEVCQKYGREVFLWDFRADCLVRLD